MLSSQLSDRHLPQGRSNIRLGLAQATLRDIPVIQRDIQVNQRDIQLTQQDILVALRGIHVAQRDSMGIQREIRQMLETVVTTNTRRSPFCPRAKASAIANSRYTISEYFSMTADMIGRCPCTISFTENSVVILFHIFLGFLTSSLFYTL